MSKLSLIGGVALALIGCTLSISRSANAAELFVTSNAIDKCQAFTPGITNTVRNRVRGAENIGPATIAIGCSFEIAQVPLAGGVRINFVALGFQNNSAKPITVKCTMLPGNSGDFGEQKLQAVQMDPGALAAVQFDNVGVFSGVGVACDLPPLVTITQTAIEYANAQ